MGCCQQVLDSIPTRNTHAKPKASSVYNENLVDVFMADYKFQTLKLILQQHARTAETLVSDFSRSVTNFDLRFSRKNTKLVQKHNEELECPICSFVYSRYREKPLLLPCGHTFCKKCIEKQFVSFGVVRCSFDRIEHKEHPD